ncbi:C40 family peptidase [Streptomyces sp. NPDC004031]
MKSRIWWIGGGIAGVAVFVVGVLVLFIAVGAGAGTDRLRLASDAAKASQAPGPAANGDLRPGSVPAEIEPWIRAAAAACPGLPAPILAAQLYRESGFNARAISPAGAQGIAQFTPGTWPTWQTDGDGDGKSSVWNPADAIAAQGRFMCALLKKATASHFTGWPVDLALAGYNAGWAAVARYEGVPPFKETTEYVAAVEAQAAAWTVESAPPVVGTGAGADSVRRAAAYVGTPYVWGGGTPEGPSVGFCSGGNGMLNGSCFAAGHAGFDCSSLVQAAWWPVLHLPRTAAAQYAATAGNPVPMASLQPGDLVFYSHTGRGTDAYHVAMYYGAGKVIEAPKTGLDVQIVDLYTTGGLVGATRPSP